MRTGRPAALLLLLMVGTPGAAQSKNVSLQKELQTAYAKLTAAQKRKDIAATMQLYTPDYTQRHTDGVRLNRAQYKAAMLHVMKSQEKVHSMRIRIDKLATTGRTATTTTTVFLKARIRVMNSKGQPVPGSTYEMAARWPVRDSWVRTAAGWRIKSSKMLAPTKATVESQ